MDGPATHPGGDKKPIVACSFRFPTRTQTSSGTGFGSRSWLRPGGATVALWAGAWGPGAAAPSLPARRAWGWGCLRAGVGSGSGPWIKAGICYSFSSNATHPRRGPLGRFWILESESESAGPVVVGGIYGRYTPIPDSHPLAIAPRQLCDDWVIKILLWMK